MKPEYTPTPSACARSLTPRARSGGHPGYLSNYMENALTVTSNRLENVSTPNADHVASIVYEPAECHFSANLLIQSLGDETL